MTAFLRPWRILAYLCIVQMALATTGKVIDVFNGEKNDILQLQTTDRLYKDGKLRNAIFNNSQSKWNVKDSSGNTVIPYIITGNFGSTEHNTIKQAMERIERNTCIRFQPRRSERDYIDIQNRRGQGCYTNVGRLNGRSVLMLEANEQSTCVAIQVVQHELLHVIGLWHEQMRYDRDKYVKVNYANIRPGLSSQFDIIPKVFSTVYNLPYDYRSVMHYGKTAFAKPGLITMETLDRTYMDVIGRQNDASPSDYQKVCNIYSCRQCNGRRPNPKAEDKIRESWEPQTTTKTTPGKRCSDTFSAFCAPMQQMGMLDCKNDYVKRICCGTCDAAIRTESSDPMDFLAITENITTQIS